MRRVSKISSTPFSTALWRALAWAKQECHWAKFAAQLQLRMVPLICWEKQLSVASINSRRRSQAVRMAERTALTWTGCRTDGKPGEEAGFEAESRPARRSLTPNKYGISREVMRQEEWNTYIASSTTSMVPLQRPLSSHRTRDIARNRDSRLGWTFRPAPQSGVEWTMDNIITFTLPGHTEDTD